MKQLQVLKFIASKNNVGKSFSDIQRFIVEGNGLNYDSKEMTNHGIKRVFRGYWCGSLLDKPQHSPTVQWHGILSKFCRKTKAGKYQLSCFGFDELKK